MTGRVEKYLLNRIRKEGAIHLTLIDPEKASPETAAETALNAETAETAAIMVGGSTITSTQQLETTVKAIKKTVEVPVILFPNNITGICRHADAIWFMSLLNSSDPYYVFGAHTLGAPLVKRFSLEPIPMGYIIVGEASAASIVGRAFPIPFDRPELAVAHALAAEYLGMRFVYLEAGSGAKRSVSTKMVETVKSMISVPLVVGGGIRTGRQAKEIAEAGADMLVTGNITEKSGSEGHLKELISKVRRK